MPENKPAATRKLAIMQPYFFPYIGYFQLINAVDKFVIYDDVNFIKRGWIHRNNLLVNGQPNLFSVPLTKASQNDLIKDVQLGTEWPGWSAKFLKTLEQNYKKAPFYAPVGALIERVLQQPVTHISRLATESLRQTCDYLDIPTAFVETSAAYQNQELKGQERILDICLQEGVGQYINPTGGRELYEPARFADNGIILNFIETKKIQYPQFKNEFVPWLSMIDVMMFNDPAAIRQLLTEYTLN